MFRRIALTLATAAVLTLGSSSVALADHLKAICDVHAVANARLEKGYVLEVTLHTSDGKPVNETVVSFYEPVELFGQRELFLGTATTDGQGNASFAYLPARLGTHEIIVRSNRKDHYLGAEGRTTFDAVVAAAPYRSQPAPLAAFSAGLPYGVGAVVLAVWLALALALFGTARGVLGGGREQRKGDLA